MTPAVLLLLSEAPAHGYELWERLEPAMPTAEPPANAGWMYRLLRRLEAEGALSSDWRRSKHGPQRRVYSITKRGRALLDEWAESIALDAREAQRFLRRYRSAQGPGRGRTAKAGARRGSRKPNGTAEAARAR
jgi:DNA-binding PadR family transcriptional regulator